jgi:hypothetical protein
MGQGSPKTLPLLDRGQLAHRETVIPPTAWWRLDARRQWHEVRPWWAASAQLIDAPTDR